MDTKLAAIARLAHLELTEEESTRMGQQLGSILSFVETLRELDTDTVGPTSHPLPGATPQRDDQAGEHLSLEAALSNAPKRDNNSFIVPKVV